MELKQYPIAVIFYDKKPDEVFCFIDGTIEKAREFCVQTQMSKPKGYMGSCTMKLGLPQNFTKPMVEVWLLDNIQEIIDKAADNMDKVSERLYAPKLNFN